jgi:acyl-coenzyme A synthetase/AMP-(fatty) acid ligase
LENVVIQHPLVHEAAVIGAWSSKEDTEIPRAFVVLKNTQDNAHGIANDISDFVSTKVSNYKKLRGGVVIIDALPRNPTGKVLKKVLKEYRGKAQDEVQMPAAKL